MMSDAYIAGLFDGEGTVVITKPTPTEPNRHRLQVVVRMADERTIRYLCASVGEGTVCAVEASRWWPGARTQYRWQVTTAAAERFLRRIRPYTVTKSRAIDVALRFRALQGQVGRANPELVLDRERCRIELQAVNAGEA